MPGWRYGRPAPPGTARGSGATRSSRRNRGAPRAVVVVTLEPEEAVSMQVLVTGATGYTGFAVATALRRAGHLVWGLVRSDPKASRLARHEVQPVIGDLAEPKSYSQVACDCPLLVHTAFGYSADGVAQDRTAIETLLDAGRRGGQPKTLIFTSGAWVYGDTGDRRVDETTQLHPPKPVAWRPAHEPPALQAPRAPGLLTPPGAGDGRAGGRAA